MMCRPSTRTTFLSRVEDTRPHPEKANFNHGKMEHKGSPATPFITFGQVFPQNRKEVSEDIALMGKSVGARTGFGNNNNRGSRGRKYETSG